MPRPGRSIGRRIARTEILASRAFVALLFVVLLAAFAVGIWGTVLRPAAYEVRGVLVARPTPDLIVVRHEPVAGLGLGAMELMAVPAEPVAVGEVPGTDQEERGTPRAAPVGAMAGGAKAQIQALGPGHARRRLWGVEQPRQAAREGADRREHDHERGDRAAHGGEDST